MKITLLIVGILSCLNCYANDEYIDIQTKRPDDFVNVQQVIPQMQFDIRYASHNNFVGRPINGYQAPLCLLTKKASVALQSVESALIPLGLTLKAYDCYRPQSAVDDFVEWAEHVNDIKMKAAYYPHIDKKNLFSDGYIAYQSGHSRGSTIDLTIVPINSQIPKYNPRSRLKSCELPSIKREPDNSLDFGTGFDCFSLLAHPDYTDLLPQAKANRLLLASLMEKAGFKGLSTEWWHFTLKEEPYPETFFDFPVK